MSSSRPTWINDAIVRLSGVTHPHISRFPEPPRHAREAAVLIALRDRGDGPETLLVTRSSQLRAHAGQVAFPGGAVEPSDDGPVSAAIREASEETTLDVSRIEPLLTWPKLWIPVSGFAVTPVFVWCEDHSEIRGYDHDTEIVSVHALPLAAAADPSVRRQVQYSNGAIGPAFAIEDVFIWGFTGLVLDRLLHFLEIEQPWTPAVVVELPSTTPAPPDSLGPADGVTGVRR